MTSLKHRYDRDDEDTPRVMFTEWLSSRLVDLYGDEAAPSIARDVAEIMESVKVTEWCDRPNCWGEPGCRTDSFSFVLCTPKDKYDMS